MTDPRPTIDAMMRAAAQIEADTATGNQSTNTEGNCRMIMPERIWAEEPETFDNMGFWQADKSADLVEYVRADIAINRDALDELLASMAVLIEKSRLRRSVAKMVEGAPR